MFPDGSTTGWEGESPAENPGGNANELTSLPDRV